MKSSALNVRHNVPFRFDGKSIRNENSDQGELIKGSIISGNESGPYDPATDQVLLMPESKGAATTESFTSVAKRLGVAVWNTQDLAKANLTMAFDRDGDGKVDVNKSMLSKGWAQTLNFVGEGSVTFNGKETVSIGEKQKAGSVVFKTLNAELDAKNGTYQQSFTHDAPGYAQYSKHMDGVRIKGAAAAVAGIGAFLYAKNSMAGPASAAVGVTGLLLAFTGGVVASMAKLDSDIPVSY